MVDETDDDRPGRLVRLRLRVGGTVQGVGFRPFVHRVASELRLTGSIGNDDDGVWCEVQGSRPALEAFERRLVEDAPALARIEAIAATVIEARAGETAFAIEPSRSVGGAAAATIPPDVAPCRSCSAEVQRAGDRRHRYPFTCCTDCGPRYTVVRSLPYDRERTSMAPFAMCELCRREYETPGDRRHHAQANSCPRCGPRLSVVSFRSDEAGDGAAAGDPADGDPLDRSVAALRTGAIVALKGVGGYQLLCRADDADAVARLRRRKRRDEKPFAVLVASVDAAAELVELDDAGIRALTGPETPILLATRRTNGAVAENVAPGSRLLGVMLPASPLHLLVARAVGGAVVCTSGNVTDDPLAIDDSDAAERLGGIADLLLKHDRVIERRADDSVGAVVAGSFQILRRARGFAPRPVDLGTNGEVVLGVGAELKNTVCLAADRAAHVSAHVGDLENEATLRAFEGAVADLLSLTRAAPVAVAHDLHPEYLSTKFALAQDIAPTVGIQHHHAHLASCLADNGHDAPVVGVTFDGFGWGTDATLWGGEFLVGDASAYVRAAHIRPVGVPGGVQAVREPWRMAVAHLVAADESHDRIAARVRRDVADVGRVAGLVAASLETSSVGRLFDAVAALAGTVDTVTYEGQAAILLEQAATRSGWSPRFGIDDEPTIGIDPAPVFVELVDRLERGADAGEVAAGFHDGVARMIVDVCGRLRDRGSPSTVALSGGVFQNRRLVELTVPLLEARGFVVLRHRQVPPNDGGISLGQVAVARATVRAIR